MAVTDPTLLYRLRDGVYAPDLLIVAIAELDLFTRLLASHGVSAEQLCDEFQLDARAADVMVTYLVALGLLERGADGRIVATPVAADHLVAGSRFDLRAYFGSLKERPACRELLGVLRTGEPAAWASAASAQDWESRLGDLEFAKRITSAMDARGAFLGSALAAAVDDLPRAACSGHRGKLGHLLLRAGRPLAGAECNRVRTPTRGPSGAYAARGTRPW
jgi:hypothetical protein